MAIPNQKPVQAQPAILLSVKLSPDEATLILGKLNQSQFLGFTESSLALSIYAKIQNAEKLPAATMGPTTTQMNGIKKTEPSNLGQLREVFSKEPAAPQQPVTPSFTSPPHVKPVVDETPKSEESDDVEDERPGAPLKALDEAKSEASPVTPVLEEDDEKVNIPPEDTPAFGVVDHSTKKDGTDKYI